MGGDQELSELASLLFEMPLNSYHGSRYLRMVILVPGSKTSSRCPFIYPGCRHADEVVNPFLSCIYHYVIYQGAKLSNSGQVPVLCRWTAPVLSREGED
jgi:hypothetical protein